MTALRLAEPSDAADLATLLDRLRWLHEQAGPRAHHEPAARLIGLGDVLAVYADTPFDTLAVRGLALGEPASLDVTVALADLRPAAELPLPTRQLAAPDLALLPPLTGWSQAGEVTAADVETALADARAALDPARAFDQPGPVGVPAKAFYTARLLGFLAPGDPVTVYARGEWRRLRGRFGGVAIRLAPAGLPLLF